MEINGQDWQDEIVYQQFIANEEKNNNYDRKNSNSFETDFQKTIEELSEKKDYIEAYIYSQDKKIIRPGSSALINTGIPVALLKLYKLKLQLLANIELSTWLRISPFFVEANGMAFLDLQNIAQNSLAKEELLGYLNNYTKDHHGVFKIDINNLDKERHHVSYSIKKGDKLAQMILRRK